MSTAEVTQAKSIQSDSVRADVAHADRVHDVASTASPKPLVVDKAATNRRKHRATPTKWEPEL